MEKRETIGILGGMGPLASAEFVKTIYEYGCGEREQDLPIVLMDSDPTFPDRTQSLLAGDYELLLSRLNESLNRLREFGASRIVICCVTIHYLLPKLMPELRRSVISLLDVIFALVAKDPKQHLMVCTTGSRRLQIYEQHESWRLVKDRIIMPDETDQTLIHDAIYRIKGNNDISQMILLLESLLSKYDTDSLIAGCTEVHLLAKHLASSGSERGISCLDPLLAIAKDLAPGKFGNGRRGCSMESRQEA